MWRSGGILYSPRGDIYDFQLTATAGSIGICIFIPLSYIFQLTPDGARCLLVYVYLFLYPKFSS